MFACQQSRFSSLRPPGNHPPPSAPPMLTTDSPRVPLAVPGSSNGRIHRPVAARPPLRGIVSSCPPNHPPQSGRTESHDPHCVAHAAYMMPPAIFFFFLSSSLVTIPFLSRPNSSPASQSLRRFSRAESSRGSSSSSIENTRCVSRSKTREDPPERLPKVSPNATCG